MRQIPPEAARQLGLFTTGQALRAAWTSHALRHAADHGGLERVRPGVYAEPLASDGSPYDDAEQVLRRRAMAVALTHRRMTLSHGASASLQRLPLLDVPSLPCVTYPRPFRGGIRGAHLHRARLWPGDVQRFGPALVTDAARTVVDLARELGADQGIAAADAALRSGITTPEVLEAVLERCRGWPGSRVARRVVDLADPAAESALESVSRLRIVDAGLPLPLPQRNIRIAGRFAGRVDFYWDEFGVVGEADGMAKYDEDRFALRAEKRRQGPMESAGLIFVRWGWEDLSHFGPVAAELRAAFARGVRPDRAPRLWTASASWHPTSAVS